MLVNCCFVWVSVSLTGKVSNGCIKDLEFNLTAYIKNWLMSWSDNNELPLKANVISWNSLKKKKKLVALLVLTNNKSQVEKKRGKNIYMLASKIKSCFHLLWWKNSSFIYLEKKKFFFFLERILTCGAKRILVSYSIIGDNNPINI